MRGPRANADVERCGLRKTVSGVLLYKSIGFIISLSYLLTYPCYE
jgi:hypothetical protein